ncbi:MAG: response regulator [PVC group bacterium]|nr:response regulator [PVC group bacterium]
MGKMKILIIDDEAIIREIFLSAFDEYEIIPAASGEEALNILDANKNIPLVVADISMPGLSGVDLIRQIKDKNPDGRIIVLTGYSSKNEEVKAVCQQTDGYIEKPFDIGKTQNIFKNLLQGVKSED